MQLKTFCSIFFVLLTIFFFWTNRSYSQNQHLISNVNLIDVESGEIVTNQNVLTLDGIIHSITDEKPLNSSYDEIDGKGKYLIPGLINMYTHVNEDNLWLYLANGQTTVKDAPSHLTALGLRDRIDNGEIIGPRIFAVGLRATGMPSAYSTQQPSRTPEEAITQVQEAKRLGYDGMFIYGSCDPDTYQPILDEAKRLEFPISGHFPQNVDLDRAINGSQESFDNLTVITRRGKLRFDKEEFIEGLKASGKVLTPTLTIHRLWSKSDKKDSIYNTIRKEYIPNKMKANWLPIVNGPGSYPYHEVEKLVKELYQNGIQLFIGSDGGFPLVINGFAYHDEIENFSRLGISNEAILKMATIQSAKHLGYQNLGLIKEGFLADMVLLDGNPLLKLENLKKINHIILKGRPVSKVEIDKNLENLKERLSNHRPRFENWTGKMESWDRGKVTKYQFVNNDLIAGEEIIYIEREDNRNFNISSLNVMDGPDFRETYYFGRVRNRKIDSIYVESKTPEGTYWAAIKTNKTTAFISGEAPYHGSFEYEEPIEPGTLLLGPFCSRYFEMDTAVNYVLAVMLKRRLSTNQADQLPVVQIELNSEEFGKKLIVDNSEYTIFRSSEDTLKIIYNGMSGHRSITAPSNVIDVTIDSENKIGLIKQGSMEIRPKEVQ